MSVRFTDSMTGELVDFEPAVPGRVTMYACGPTVYDHPHLGHGRTAITFDVVRRYLEWRGHEVVHVANITDIDDNMIERAAERNVSVPELAAEFEAIYVDRMRDLGVADPHHRPRATAHIDEMIETIRELEEKGVAYQVQGAGVYFSVDAYDDYGRLVGRSPDELREGAGARIEVDDRKRDPLDFALWKAAKPGEPSWPSPWGQGRPGWHIECVAMSLGLLGDGFDIHGGGTDLVFPHHENERAEAEAAGHPFARHWLHSAMVNVEGEKMSKSLDNFRTVADALEHYEGRAIRLAMLQTHYRSTMEIGEASLGPATSAIERLDAWARRAEDAGLAGDSPVDDAAVEAFVESMDLDFGTPGALAVIFDLVRAGHAALDEGEADRAASIHRTIVELTGVLGIPLRTGRASGGDSDRLDVEALLAERAQARDDRDFARADEIRDQLADAGIVIEDTASGTTWHRR